MRPVVMNGRPHSFGSCTMCYEDIRLGLRRQYKVTRIDTNATAQLPANKQRVLLRMLYNIGTDGFGRIFIGTQALANSLVIMNGTTQFYEMTLEKYGSLVQEEFFIRAGTGGDMCVIEVFDPELDRPPQLGDPYVTKFD